MEIHSEKEGVRGLNIRKELQNKTLSRTSLRFFTLMNFQLPLVIYPQSWCQLQHLNHGL